MHQVTGISITAAVIGNFIKFFKEKLQLCVGNFIHSKYTYVFSSIKEKNRLISK